MFRTIIAALGLLVFSTYAQQPELKGGLASFLREHTIYPGYSKHHCIQGIVKVSFKINEQGSVRQAAVVEGIGADLDDEALRLIKLTNGKWIVPAGYDTTAVLIVPVNFALNGYGCERVSKATIASALQAYTNHEEVLNIIGNYYRAKEKGTANPSDEAGILRIKAEIGVDDDYLDNIINLGLKKIKQGDKEGACKEFTFVKYMGSDKANEYLSKYCN